MANRTSPSSSHLVINKMESALRPTETIGISIQPSLVLVGTLTPKNELTVFLVLKDTLEIYSKVKDSHIIASEINLRLLLQEESSRRHIIQSNGITFPLSTEHILAIYFIKTFSMLKEQDVNLIEKTVVILPEENVTLDMNKVQKSLALVYFACSSASSLTSIANICLQTPDGYRFDCASKLEPSTSFPLKKLLELLDFTNDVKIEAGEYSSYSSGPTATPELSPEIIKLVEISLAQAVEEGSKSHEKRMYPIADRKEPLTEAQLKKFHSQSLESVLNNFILTYDHLASSDLLIASSIKDAKEMLQRKIKLQLATYLTRHENSMNVLLKKVREWIMFAEEVYDDEMVEFNPEKRTKQEITVKHNELEMKTVQLLQQKFLENKLDWQDFWKIELQSRLQERLEEQLQDLFGNLADLSKFSSLSSPQLVMKSMQRVRYSSSGNESSRGGTPSAPPNSISNMGDSPPVNIGIFSNREENYLQDETNYEDSATEIASGFSYSYHEKRKNAVDSKDANQQEEDQELQFGQEISVDSGIFENGPQNAAEVSVPGSQNRAGHDSEEVVEAAVLSTYASEAAELPPPANASTKFLETEDQSTLPAADVATTIPYPEIEDENIDGRSESPPELELVANSILSDTEVTKGSNPSPKTDDSEIKRQIEEALHESSTSSDDGMPEPAAAYDNGAKPDAFITTKTQLEQQKDTEAVNDIAQDVPLVEEATLFDNSEEEFLQQLGVALSDESVEVLRDSLLESIDSRRDVDPQFAEGIRKSTSSEDMEDLICTIQDSAGDSPMEVSVGFSALDSIAEHSDDENVLEEIQVGTNEEEPDSSFDSSGRQGDYSLMSLQEELQEASASCENLTSMEDNSLVRLKAAGYSGSTQSLPEKITDSIRRSKKKESKHVIYESSLNIHKL